MRSLVVGGLGPHTIQLGKGNNILLDGMASLVDPADSFLSSALPSVGLLSVNIDTVQAIRVNL